MSRYVWKTKREFEKHFRATVLPTMREHYPMEKAGRVDVPARREVWNDLVDALVREGELPPHAINWSPPW